MSATRLNPPHPKIKRAVRSVAATKERFRTVATIDENKAWGGIGVDALLRARRLTRDLKLLGFRIKVASHKGVVRVMVTGEKWLGRKQRCHIVAAKHPLARLWLDPEILLDQNPPIPLFGPRPAREALVIPMPLGLVAVCTGKRKIRPMKPLPLIDTPKRDNPEEPVEFEPTDELEEPSRVRAYG